MNGVLLPAQAAGDLWQTVLGLLPAAHPHDGQADATQVRLRPEHVDLLQDGLAAAVLERSFRGSYFIDNLLLAGGEHVMAHTPLATQHDPVRHGLRWSAPGHAAGPLRFGIEADSDSWPPSYRRQGLQDLG